jgi:hypothetical protein
MIRIFMGYDSREAVGYHVCAQSILETCSAPFSITPIRDSNQRDGSNQFTYSRFLVPYLCDYEGWALYIDGSDMLVMRDIVELLNVHNPFYSANDYPVRVVKHNYKTKHLRKYIGTPMECDNVDYPRKNQSSVMLFNCGHFVHRILTPAYVAAKSGRDLHTFRWVEDNGFEVGFLAEHWNFLVGEQEVRKTPCIAHYTLGIPAFEHYRDCDYSQEWHATRARAGL